MCLDKMVKRLRFVRASFFKSRAASEENSILNPKFIFKGCPRYRFAFTKFFPGFFDFPRKFRSRLFSNFFEKFNIILNWNKNHWFIDSNCLWHNLTSNNTIPKPRGFVNGGIFSYA